VFTRKRAPLQPLHVIAPTLTELCGPCFGADAVAPNDHDLTRQHAGEPIGERIIVSGRVLDEDGQGIPAHAVEIWQANAAGRYRHEVDAHARRSIRTSPAPAAASATPKVGTAS
jgi:protocatechuate 3,4-dioxygenase beta subunit